MEHLESQFTEGMTRDNHSYDGWTIEHILAIYHFDLSSEEEVRWCWSLENLKPLWGPDNFSKGNKIIIEQVEKLSFWSEMKKRTQRRKSEKTYSR